MDDTSIRTNVDNLWEQFSKPLLGFIKKRVHNEQDAEDILQNVFYKIHNNINRLLGVK